MLLGDDMIDVKRVERIGIVRKQTILTTLRSTLPDSFAGALGHRLLGVSRQNFPCFGLQESNEIALLNKLAVRFVFFLGKRPGAGFFAKLQHVLVKLFITAPICNTTRNRCS